jgi:RNA recognition motif-containing protein
VVRKRRVSSSSYGFVVFQHKEHAEQAMTQENGSLWMTKRIRVNHAKSEEKKDYEIIISHLPISFTEDQIRAIFSQVNCLNFFHSSYSFIVWEYSSHSIRDYRNVTIPRLLSEVSDGRAMPNRLLNTTNSCSSTSLSPLPPPAIMLLNGRLLEGALHPIIIQFVDSDLIATPKCSEREVSPFTDPSSRSPRTDIELASLQSASPTIEFAFSEISPPVESTILVSSLPPMVTALQLLSLFSPFGQILEIVIHTAPSFDGSQLLCTGTAILRLYGSIHLRDSALGCLHGAFIFPYHPPIALTLYPQVHP